MTQIFNPLLDQAAAKNLQDKDLRQSGLLKRMCWTCQQEKPMKGGVFPNFKGGKSVFKAVERFRCADCTERLIAKRKEQETRAIKRAHGIE
jgi:hypothetical protein